MVLNLERGRTITDSLAWRGTILCTVLCVFAVLSCGRGAAEWGKPTLIDLTHNFDGTTIYWPTSSGFEFKRGFTGRTEMGFYYEGHSFCAAEHGGTHLDAPIHFSEGHSSVEDVALERLIGPGVLVDVSERISPDYMVEIGDFLNWESKNGKLPNGWIVLLRTGYGERWPDRERYLGTALNGSEAVSHLRFPGLAAEAALWLHEERSISAIGIDTASIDQGRSQFFKTHQVLSQNNIPIFENLANLDQLPVSGFTVVALPMKIRSGSGAPLRAVAIVDDRWNN